MYYKSDRPTLIGICFILIINCISVSFSQDEFIHKGSHYTFFFSELLDAEIYSDNIAYVVGVGGFIFYDISNLENPEYLGRHNPGSIYIRYYNGIAKNSFGIGAARLDGLYFLNISDFSNPRLLSRYGQFETSYESADFKGTYVYAATHQNGLEIIDIADPKNPVHHNNLSEFENSWDVLIDGDILYIADGPGGLKIYSISDPSAPIYLATVQTSGYATEVIIKDQLALVALGAAGFDIIDISNPANPEFLSNFSNLFGIVNHLAVSDQVVFAATWELLLAVDISTPEQPRLIATEDTPVRAMGVAANGDEIVLADWSRIHTYTFTDQMVSDIHIKPTEYDFGYRGVNMPIKKEFQIFNLGETDLEITDMLFDDTQFFIDPVNFSVPPGDDKTIEITFVPKSAGQIHRAIQFQTNDPDEVEKNLRVTGGEARLAPGDPAPEFTLKDLNGIEHRLSDYRGTTVLLTFFATW